MTPGVQNVDSYETNSWLNVVLFNNGVGLQRPVTGTGILANHSWVGATTNATQVADLLNRLDWLIDVDNSAQIVGVNTNTRSEERRVGKEC